MSEPMNYFYVRGFWQSKEPRNSEDKFILLLLNKLPVDLSGGEMCSIERALRSAYRKGMEIGRAKELI